MRPGDVCETEDLLGNEVAQKLGGAQNVLRVLERDRGSSDMSTAYFESEYGLPYWGAKFCCDDGLDRFFWRGTELIAGLAWDRP